MLVNYTGIRAARSFFFLSFALGLPAFATVTACGGGTPGAGANAGGLGTAGTATAAALDPSAPTTSTKVPDLDGGSGQKLVATQPSADPAAATGPEPGRGPNDIRNAVLAKRTEARACFDQVAKGKPGLEGNIVVKWLIDPKGAVKDVIIDPDKTTVPDQTIGSCIIGVISKLTFPPSAKRFETKASYPFNFKAGATATP